MGIKYDKISEIVFFIIPSGLHSCKKKKRKKKTIFIGMNVLIVSLGHNLTSNHENSIRFVLPYPKIIEKLDPR